jgi:hypothetical protein
MELERTHIDSPFIAAFSSGRRSRGEGLNGERLR